MTIYALAFLGVMGVMLLVAIAALYFLSSEPRGVRRQITSRYDVVRTIDTHTIETVDRQGNQRRWHKMEH